MDDKIFIVCVFVFVSERFSIVQEASEIAYHLNRENEIQAETIDLYDKPPTPIATKKLPTPIAKQTLMNRILKEENIKLPLQVHKTVKNFMKKIPQEDEKVIKVNCLK